MTVGPTELHRKDSGFARQERISESSFQKRVAGKRSRHPSGNRGLTVVAAEINALFIRHLNVLFIRTLKMVADIPFLYVEIPSLGISSILIYYTCLVIIVGIFSVYIGKIPEQT